MDIFLYEQFRTNSCSCTTSGTRCNESRVLSFAPMFSRLWIACWNKRVQYIPLRLLCRFVITSCLHYLIQRNCICVHGLINSFKSSFVQSVLYMNVDNFSRLRVGEPIIGNWNDPYQSVQLVKNSGVFLPRKAGCNGRLFTYARKLRHRTCNIMYVGGY